MRARAIEAAKDIIARDRDTLIVCHGGVIALLFNHFFPDSGLNWYEVQPVNGEGYTFEFEGNTAVSYSRIPIVQPE